MAYTARTMLSLTAWGSGSEFEAEMVVKFTVTKYRAQTQIDPEEPATVENISIRLFTEKGATELACPTWLDERFSDDDGFKDWLMSEAAASDEYARDCKADADRDERRLGL